MGNTGSFFSRDASASASRQLQVELESGFRELDALAKKVNRQLHRTMLDLGRAFGDRVPRCRPKDLSRAEAAAYDAIEGIRLAKQTLKQAREITQKWESAEERSAHFAFAEFKRDRGDKEP